MHYTTRGRNTASPSASRPTWRACALDRSANAKKNRW